MLQNAALSGNQRPDRPKSRMNISLLLRLPRDMHLSRSSSNAPCMPSLLKLATTFCSLLPRCRILCACITKTTSECPKAVRTCGAINCIWTWKCASRHNGVHFFDISTSKSGPILVCFAGNVLHTAIWPADFAPAALASLLFDPPDTQNTVNRDLPTFPRTCIFFFSHSFFCLIFSLLFFSSLTLPTSAFPSVHIVGRLTSTQFLRSYKN